MQKIKKFIKNSGIRIKYYKPGKSNIEGNTVVFFMDKGYGQPHPGLVDRFKAIIGLYYIAQENGFDFKLHYTTPFRLEEYLDTAGTDWSCHEGELSYRSKDVELLTYEAAGGLPVLNKRIPQYHCYYYEGLNMLRAGEIPDWEKKWHDMFCQLFVPGQELRKLLERVRPKQAFVSVHFRFVNALDSFEKGYGCELCEKEKQHLITQCLNVLDSVTDKESIPVYVFSDSIRFMRMIKAHGYHSLPSEHIGHISFETERQVYQKTFVDFYTMSFSEKVYAVQGKNLYNSVFSQYAAIVGEKPYEIIRLGD